MRTILTVNGASPSNHRREIVVVTPARDESVHLPSLVSAMRAQSRPPETWVIVDDGSVDRTGELAREACADLPWVTVVDQASSPERSFGSKARAVAAGVQVALGPATEIIMNLDADIVLPPDYLERVASAFDADPRLGVFGGVYTYRSRTGVRRQIGPANHVSGGIQAFRRSVYEEIGGYRTLPYGGEDVVASVTAEMAGWTVRRDASLVCEHRRDTGTADASRLGAHHRFGLQDHDLGTAPWFELVRSARIVLGRPILIGSAARLAGYVRGSLGGSRSVSPAFVDHLRQRHRERLRRSLRRPALIERLARRLLDNDGR